MRALMRKRPLPYDAAAARRHLLRTDGVIRNIVTACGPLGIEARGRPYEALLRAILYQQLAGPAAAAIERRFLALFDGIPAPSPLAASSDELLRTAGISRQKASYMRSLGEHFASGELNDHRLMRAPDDEVIDTVTPVKGIGRWTADMLLMFCLGRPDVLPVGNLGIQNAMRAAYALPTVPKADEMLDLAEPWRPFRSAASWYLWRHGDTVTM